MEVTFLFSTPFFFQMAYSRAKLKTVANKFRFVIFFETCFIHMLFPVAFISPSESQFPMTNIQKSTSPSKQAIITLITLSSPSG